MDRCRIIACLTLLSTEVLASQVYRCQEAGRLRFSDRPCVPGQAPLVIAAPNTMESSAGDEALARDYDARIARLRAPAVAGAAREKGPASDAAAAKKKPRKAKAAGASRKAKSAPPPPSRDREPAHIARPRK